MCVNLSKIQVGVSFAMRYILCVCHDVMGKV